MSTTARERFLALETWDRSVGPQDASLAAELADELAALPPRERLETADRAKLPISARRLGKTAGPVLRLLIEDPVMRPFFADGAARLWLELDVDDALPAALGIAAEVGSMTFIALVARVDKEEAFELIAERYQRDAFFCELVGRVGLVGPDDRWVPMAMERVRADPRSACRILGLVGTPRAVEELAGIVDAAEDVDATLLSALDTMNELAQAHADTVVAALVRLLEKPFAAALAKTAEGRAVYVYRHALVTRALAGHAHLLDVLEQIAPSDHLFLPTLVDPTPDGEDWDGETESD